MTRHSGLDQQGEEFVGCDFSGATFRESGFVGTRIVGAWVDGLSVESFAGELQGSLYVDGVDVVPFVRAELEKRFPERALARDASTAAEIQAAWPVIRQAWESTIARASELPQASLEESVDGEFSFIQTLRHLLLGIDTWVGHMLMDPPTDWHRWGWPFLGLGEEAVAEMGLDLAATPTLAEVAEVVRGRWDQLGEQIAALTDDSMGEEITGRADPERTITETRAHCLLTLLNEQTEHRRFAVRDLDTLDAMSNATQSGTTQSGTTMSGGER